MKPVTVLSALFAVALLSGCQTTTVRKSATASFDWASATKKVVMVEPDVQLGSLQAAGGVEWRADWTTTALELISKHVSVRLSGKGVELVKADNLTDQHEVQLVKLHGAVGQAILLHLYNPALKLPTKGDALDWSIGPGANALRSHYGADYALFVYVRDSYTSSGRAMLMLGAAILGVGVQGGQQVGFASLVDLRTGNIVWFNRIANGSGDLRTDAPAKKTVEDLLRDLPI
jgi:hypothetical protein